jgi:predicted ArsR family transcriptional regulator
MRQGGSMGLLDGLEKLINEHGSATILRERIALANDKYAALEQKLSDAESRIKTLDIDNVRLRSDLDAARAELQTLKAASSRISGQQLDDMKEKILVFLSKHDDCVAQQIAQAIGAGAQVVTFHLEELNKSKMVSASHTMGSDWMGTQSRTGWFIAHSGRGYLISRGLIT